MHETPVLLQAPVRQLQCAGARQIGMLECYLTPLPNAVFSYLSIKYR